MGTTEGILLPIQSSVVGVQGWYTGFRVWSLSLFNTALACWSLGFLRALRLSGLGRHLRRWGFWSFGYTGYIHISSHEVCHGATSKKAMA